MFVPFIFLKIFQWHVKHLTLKLNLPTSVLILQIANISTSVFLFNFWSHPIFFCRIFNFLKFISWFDCFFVFDLRFISGVIASNVILIGFLLGLNVNGLLNWGLAFWISGCFMSLLCFYNYYLNECYYWNPISFNIYYFVPTVNTSQYSRPKNALSSPNMPI